MFQVQVILPSSKHNQTESSLQEVKSQIKLILRRLNRNSEPQATIESGAYTLQYVHTSWKLRLCAQLALNPLKHIFPGESFHHV